MWYDRCSNSIRSAIDGSIVTLATAYNASRIISYIVIRTSRYADIPLLDMRVHDIDVGINVRATLPWVPEPPKSEEPKPSSCDGTSLGYKACSAAVGFANTVIGTCEANTISWWTGWWPVLHVKTVGSLATGASYTYQIAVDLLGSFALENMAMHTPRSDGVGSSTVQAMVNEGVTDYLQNLPLADLAIVAMSAVLMTGIEVLVVMCAIPTPPVLTALAILVTIYLALEIASVEMT